MMPQSVRCSSKHTENKSIIPSEKACLLVSRRRQCPIERCNPLSNQTLAHDPRSLVRLCHETCCLLHRLLHANAVDGHVACSHRRTVDVWSLSIFVSICGVHSCIFTAGVVTDFAFAPSRFICASKISRWRGLASISISFRDPERQTQVTNRFRIVTSPSSGPRFARLLRINPSLSRDSIHANSLNQVISVHEPT